MLTRKVLAVLLLIFQNELGGETHSKNKMVLNFSEETVHRRVSPNKNADNSLTLCTSRKWWLKIKTSLSHYSSAWVVTNASSSYWSPGTFKSSQPSDSWLSYITWPKSLLHEKPITLKSNQPSIQHLIFHICTIYDQYLHHTNTVGKYDHK